jgi:hypothetical protein
MLLLSFVSSCKVVTTDSSIPEKPNTSHHILLLSFESSCKVVTKDSSIPEKPNTSHHMLLLSFVSSCKVATKDSSIREKPTQTALGPFRLAGMYDGRVCLCCCGGWRGGCGRRRHAPSIVSRVTCHTGTLQCTFLACSIVTLVSHSCVALLHAALLRSQSR